MNSTEFFTGKTAELKVICPKHGTHKQYIESNVKGHEGHWCMLCWLESLGEPLPTSND
jgi:hypothetical protein